MTDPQLTARAVAAQHADLGLPVPKGTRFRSPKRLLARLGRLFTHRQASFNHAVLSLLDEHETAIARQRSALSAAETRVGNDVGSLRSDLRHVHQAALVAQTASAGVREELLAADARALETAAAAERVSSLAAELSDRLDDLERIHRAQRSLVDLFLREVRRDYPAAPKRKRLAKLAARADDELYAALEDAFRGSIAQVTEWQRPYLLDVEAGARSGPVLDLGSGRGEWLTLLREAGIAAYGVDTNKGSVERCRARGLDVRREDAFSHLAGLGEGSVAVVSAFHFVEHLDHRLLLRLLDQAVRVLRPGGLLLMETPNPTNVVVGSGQFWLDPTHARPLHPLLLEFLVRSRGFDDVEVRYLHPRPDRLEPSDHSEAARKTLEPVVERLNELLFGPQDYAVLARRARR